MAAVMGMIRSSRASQADAARERDDLLSTKIAIPRIPPDRLARSRLIEALDDAKSRELILVCGPAGFGKTTVLADWAAGSDWPVAWAVAGSRRRRPGAFLAVRHSTVKKHASHILAKLDATSRTHAVARARELGLIS
jgi:ATP/maltotriose-dependent transcriptional regulator MalT